MFSDINRCMRPWGTAGQMDPFKNIYDLVFQMTIRVGCCEELATDPRAVQKISDLYWQYEKGVTPMSLLLPWFPSMARKQKNQAIRGLYSMLSHHVDVRRKAKQLTSDAYDVLIAEGEDNATIVEVCVTVTPLSWTLISHVVACVTNHICRRRQHGHDLSVVLTASFTAIS